MSIYQQQFMWLVLIQHNYNQRLYPGLPQGHWWVWPTVVWNYCCWDENFNKGLYVACKHGKATRFWL